MNIAISMEMTRKLRDTWHAALNHEWYDFLSGHRITPWCCHDPDPDFRGIDLVILAGGNDMADIRTWRDNHYPLRDRFEKYVIERCLEIGVPLAGVCRGAHFLNFTMGGTHRLMQDPYDGTITELSQWPVTCHHSIQIDRLAPEFEALEQDHRGVIELARHRPNRQLMIGWHPERSVNSHTRSYILELLGSL